MTLGELFQVLNQNPEIVVFYFLVLPLTALLAWQLGKGQGHESPWKYLYSFIIYAAAIPAIFAVTLTIYYFLFEHRSILDTDLFTQVEPLISFALTIFLVRKNVNMDNIPGFDKLGGLVIIIAVVMSMMWILDRLRLIAFTYIPFQYVLIMLVVMVLGLVYGWRRLSR